MTRTHPGSRPAIARFRVAGTAVLLTLAAGLGAVAKDERPPSSRPNIVLVSIDTLRADHLGCYGYILPSSPAIDAFRRDAVLFRQAFAHASSTLPSHASLFTGLVPQRHQASHTDSRPLSEKALTLAEVLSRNGYRTLGFTNGGQVSAAFGLGQGFDRYEELVDSGESPAMFRRVVARATPSLGGQADKPFFLFLHTYETHHPYVPFPSVLRALDPGYAGSLPDAISVPLLEQFNFGGRSITAADLQHVMHTYDAEIRSMDATFGRLIEELKRRGLYGDSLIVFTSDHGEEFGERGFVGWHGHTLYDELLRVPLLMKLPGARHAGVEAPSAVRSIDIAPTILALAGIEPPPGLDGRDLMPVVRGEERLPRATVLWRERIPEVSNACSGLRTSRFKIHCGKLFDLRRDLSERQDVAGLHPEVIESFERTLAEEAAKGSLAATESITVNEELRKQLRALGYVDRR